jgi:hypothetical protein
MNEDAMDEMNSTYRKRRKVAESEYEKRREETAWKI